MIWKFLNTGFQSGSFNMQVDEHLARNFEFNVSPPILRVYGWNPSTISLGHNQNIEDFDSDKIARAGFEIVRRPTGGKAIFHAHELTYSIVMELGDRGPRAVYDDINRGLLEGLEILGIGAQLAAQDEEFRKHYQSRTSIPCFSSTAKNEIQFNGRKLIGSAQRRFGKVILQHGSFLLGPQHRRLVEFLSPQAEGTRKLLEDSFLNKTTEAETILGRTITFDEAVSAVRKGFEEKFNIVFEKFRLENMPDELTDVLTTCTGA